MDTHTNRQMPDKVIPVNLFTMAKIYKYNLQNSFRLTLWKPRTLVYTPQGPWCHPCTMMAAQTWWVGELCADGLLRRVQHW